MNSTYGCCTGLRPQLNAEKLQKLLQLLRVLPTKGIPDDMPEFDEILEDVKQFLRDVDDFLSNTLKKEKLKRDTNSRKEELLSELNVLQGKLPPERIEEEDELEACCMQTKEENKENKDPEDITMDCMTTEEYTAPEDVGVFREPEPFVMVSHDGQEDSVDDIYDDTENPTPMDTTVSSSDPDQTRTEQDDNGNDINADNRSINWDEPYGDMKINPIAATALDTPIKTGWLEKKRKEGQIGLPGWQTRFCVIKANILYYYKKETDKKQCNCVILNGYEGRPAAKHKKNQFFFDLVCPAKRSFQFFAKTEDDMKDWIEAIKKASTSPPDATLAERTVTAGSVSNASSTSRENLLDNQELEETTMNTTADTDDFYDDTANQESSTTSLEPQSSIDQDTQDFGETYEVMEKTDDNQILDDNEELYEPVNLDDIQQTTNITEARKPLPITTNQTMSQRPQPTIPSRPQPPIPQPTPAMANMLNSLPSNNNNEPEPWDDDYDNIYIGKWDCNPDDKDELGFQRGDLLHIISREYDIHNWWVAEKHNKVGLVPKDYLMKAYMM